MERKIVGKLKQWKVSKNRMPLILYGARQVGKTYAALSFGKEYYKNTVYFNFEDNMEISAIFERDLNPERLIKELSAKSGETILKGDTLIFFDEIQTCERALTSLKYFCENAPEYHIIAAGSLLGVAVNREKFSFPVGKVQMQTLYPWILRNFYGLLEIKLSLSLSENLLRIIPHYPFMTLLWICTELILLWVACQEVLLNILN